MRRLINSVYSLWEASDHIERDAPSPEFIARIVSDKIVRPHDNEAIAYWFARFLSIRQGLWEVIDDALAAAGKKQLTLSDQEYWRLFVIGYCAACLVIRNDRLLLQKVATHSILQRKLNEEFAEYRIPRKQFTLIFSAYVNSVDAMRLFEAVKAAKKHRNQFIRLKDDVLLGKLASNIALFESWLDTSKRSHVRQLFMYISHALRRRSVVALSRSLSKVMERCGRAAAQMNLPLDKRLTPVVQNDFSALLKPGDMLITRHDTALTNLFLPGFWPHAALYIGSNTERDRMGIEVDAGRLARWSGDYVVLEALKDGVHFRPLSETLAVDNAVVLRPNIPVDDIASAIERVVLHEGKLYNFDFDFFSSDKLVCTEVIYRAFDGVGGLDFQLTERAGRRTLSAEDLLDYAIDKDGISVEAVFGIRGAHKVVVRGERAQELVIDSYRDTQDA